MLMAPGAKGWRKPKEDQQSGEASWQGWHLISVHCLPRGGLCNSREMIAGFRWCMGTWSPQFFFNSLSYAKEKVLACLSISDFRIKALGRKRLAKI